MKRTTLALSVALVAAVSVFAFSGLATGAGSGTKQLLGALSGAKEVGPDGKKRAGDLDASGAAAGTIKDKAGGNSDLCVGLVFQGLGTLVASHIHRGQPNEAGPVVVGLFGPPTQTAPPASGDPGAFAGCVEISDALARELQKNPRKFYWNVHTSEFPGGAIRGQVRTKRA